MTSSVDRYHVGDVAIAIISGRAAVVAPRSSFDRYLPEGLLPAFDHIVRAVSATPTAHATIPFADLAAWASAADSAARVLGFAFDRVLLRGAVATMRTLGCDGEGDADLALVGVGVGGAKALRITSWLTAAIVMPWVGPVTGDPLRGAA